MSETEEEILVYAEWDENVTVDNFRTIHTLGLDKENPIIQVDNNFYIGKYEHPLGTYMFFESDPNAKCNDPLFDKLSDINLKYVCKARKFMKMERTYVTPVGETENEILHQLQNQEEQVDVLNFSSIQEAIDKFREDWKDTDDPDIKIENVDEHFPNADDTGSISHSNQNSEDQNNT